MAEEAPANEPSTETTEATAAPSEATAVATEATAAAPEDVPLTESISKKGSLMSRRESRVRVQVPEDVKPSEDKSTVNLLRTKSSLEKSPSLHGAVKSSSSFKEDLWRRTSQQSSKYKLAVGSVLGFGKYGGMGEYGTSAKFTRFMNTYKMDSDRPFQVEKVEKILKEVLTETLHNLTYDPDRCAKQAKAASNAIRMRVKEEAYDRYRIVSVVTIGEKRYHDMCCLFRFLWDIERDKYAFVVHDNFYVFAIALCFGVYYE